MKEYKEILLAAVGKTPQIITETIYYYTHPEYKSERIFDDIKLLVTSNRKENLINQLFKNAVIDAIKIAERNDVILLSPAFKSYDQFNNLEERGNEFKKIINQYYA